MSLPYFEPALFGAVQGLTEFLPISSSAHLLLLHHITHFTVADDLAFDVALHVGTLVAVVTYFWRDLWRLLRAWLVGFKKMNWTQNNDQRLAWWLVIASVPAALAGAALETKAETAFRAPLLTALVLILAGVILWLTDRFKSTDHDLPDITWRQALMIGVAQAVALVPGVSRSGATITMARLFRLNRAAAARFSFLLSAPILLGAGVKKMLDLGQMHLSSLQLADFAVGAIVAALVGLVAINILLRFISRHSYGAFAVYRLVVGGLVLAALWVGWIK